MNKIKLFDSFAGIGALHKALTNLNIPIELVGISEIDSDAIISYGGVHKIDINSIEEKSKEEMVEYLQNINVGYDFKKKKSSVDRMKLDKLKLLYKFCIATNNFGDISKLNPNDIPDFDLFNFSFPCQAISVAGKQEGMKRSDGSITSSGLYTYGIEIIKIKKPKYIMIENVKNLISKKFINDFYSIINEIEELGYNCYYPTNDKNKPKCLNAKGFGIPQNRERVFVICIRKDIDDKTFEFPIERDYGIRLKDILEDNVDEKYYLNKPWHITQPSENKHDINEIAQIDGINFKTTRSITDPNKICRCLDTMEGGQREPKILESKIIAMRGRYTKKGVIEQRLELRKDYNTNAITTVQKDNLVLENNNENVSFINLILLFYSMYK